MLTQESRLHRKDPFFPLKKPINFTTSQDFLACTAAGAESLALSPQEVAAARRHLSNPCRAYRTEKRLSKKKTSQRVILARWGARGCVASYGFLKFILVGGQTLGGPIPRLANEGSGERLRRKVSGSAGGFAASVQMDEKSPVKGVPTGHAERLPGRMCSRAKSLQV